MKKLNLFLAAFLISATCFSQYTYNESELTLNEYDVTLAKDSWVYLDYSNIIDSINTKQTDGSSWRAIKFYQDRLVPDNKIKKTIVNSKNITEIIDKLGPIHFDIPCNSSTKSLTPISEFYYTILNSGGEKVIVLMYPIGS